MKKFFFLLVFPLSFFSCATDSSPAPVVEVSTEAITWEPVFALEGDQVTITFNPNQLMEEPLDLETVGLAGTFSGWRNDDTYNLVKVAESDLWSRTFPLKVLDVPGNSGMPEFQFVLNNGTRIPGTLAPRGESWGSNFVILVPPATRESLMVSENLNRKFRSEYDSVAALSNYRSLQGGSLGKGILNRSYHPFLKSRAVAGESERLAAVQNLMKEGGVQAVINLTDTSGIAGTGQMPAYYQELNDQGKVLYLPTEYNRVYYESASPEFREEVKQILTFVADHPGPYLVHCRLGTDRTGVVTSLLGVLGGLGWEDIKADYELSNRMEIREFRSPRLLEYSYDQMLGQDPATIKNLKERMERFVLDSGVSEKTLRKVEKNLSGVP